MQIEVKGTSMIPTFNHGDQVEVRTCGVEDLRKGDVIAFWRNSSLFIHRLYGFKNEMLITKGDRCRNFDLPVSEERVIGRLVRKVTSRERNFEYIKNIMIFRIYALKARVQMFFS